MRFSVVIPTLRRPGPLRETLESLLACEPPPDEVIVVDGDPELSSAAVVEHLGSSVRILSSPLGMTVQRNNGLDAASGDVVVFLDDDVEVEPDLLRRLAETYSDPSVMGATGRIIEPVQTRAGRPGSLVRRLLHGSKEGKFTRAGYPRYLSRFDREADLEFMQGCFMSARRDLAARVRFDESLTGYALAEDEDFAYRLSRYGPIRFVPGLRVVHKKLGFASQDSREFGRLVIRNRSYLFRKNFPQTRLARTQFALLIATLVIHRLANRQWQGALGLLEGARAQLAGRR
jgi:glycosyltransferase involved in cell wall biosynthesis